MGFLDSIKNMFGGKKDDSPDPSTVLGQQPSGTTPSATPGQGDPSAPGNGTAPGGTSAPSAPQQPTTPPAAGTPPQQPEQPKPNDPTTPSV